MKQKITACFKCCHCGCEKVIHGTYVNSEDEFRAYKYQLLINDGWKILINGQVICNIHN